MRFGIARWLSERYKLSHPYTASKKAVIRAVGAPFLRISRVIHGAKNGREEG